MKTWVKYVLMFIGIILASICFRFYLKGTIEPLCETMLGSSISGIGVTLGVWAGQKIKNKE